MQVAVHGKDNTLTLHFVQSLHLCVTWGREKNIAYIIASTLFMGFMAEDFSATHFRQNTRGPGEEKDESESH